ncbi:GntR family transcriptional regulator [Ruania alba]|uniref:GntR family transcriptional regulator n=1 Tax=Ruania alba TaxID=648782 RepID=A0A1H5DM72_9MICO|nr:GntR family transcriptional regulator [Ruania alba]SED79969.1 GntR family transcriptional regulator [Ruania alba]
MSDRSSAITRESALPMYDQLRRAILATIDSESLGPGDRLPGEMQMCEMYGVSRTVVRQALGQLEHDGMITRVKGKGTFVARGKTAEALAHRLTGLHEEVTARGGQVRSRVLRLETVPADTDVADHLLCAPGTPVVVLERLRFVDDEPWSLTITWMPESIGELVAEVDFTESSLYAALGERGVRPTSGVRSVEATVTDAREGQLLGTGPSKAVLSLGSVTFDAAGRPIEYFRALHRGDRSRFEFELRASEPRSTILHTSGTH